MDSPEPGPTYSISLRLRRITFEYAYVNVPVAGDVVKLDDQGVGRIDAETLTRRAVEMAQQPEVVWYREELRVEPHPIQSCRVGTAHNRI